MPLLNLASARRLKVQTVAFALALQEEATAGMTVELWASQLVRPSKRASVTIYA